MKYLLETSTCVYLLNGNPALKARVQEVGVSSLAVANCVLAELYFGARNSKKVDENIQRIEEFKKNLTILSDSEDSARQFGRSRPVSERQAN